MLKLTTDLIREVLPLCLLLAVLLIVALLGPSALERTITDLLIKVVVVVGLFVFIGNTGVISFGHMSFMAIGAYVSAWLTMAPAMKKMRLHDLPDFLLDAQVDVVTAGLISGLSGAVAALLVGIPLLRLAGISAGIGTFAILMVTNSVIGNWDGVTGGRGSLIGLPVYLNPANAFAWSVTAILVAWIYTRSRSGLMNRAARGNEVAARATGVNIYRERLVALCVSGFIVGVGGSLQGHSLGLVSADAFFLDLTFITLAMLVVGGMGSLSGAVTGAVFVTLFLEILRRFESGFSVGGLSVAELPGLAEVCLSIVMLAILIARPGGLMQGRDLKLPSKFSTRTHRSHTT